MKKPTKRSVLLCAAAILLTAGLISCDQGGSTPASDTEPATATHTHTYNETIVAPTCTDKGYTTHVCSVCMDSYADSEVPAYGHDYADSVTPPTCTENGYAKHVCSICGDTYEDGITEASGHSYTDEVVEPTCTEGGLTVHTCSICGDTYEDGIAEALGHSYTDEVVEPTCITEGYTRHTCSVCGDTYDSDITEASSHDWSEWTVIREATCTAVGFQTHTCSVCHEEETVQIDVLPHTYGITVVDPTCTEQGYLEHLCSVCGDSYQDNFIEANGHAWAPYLRDEAEKATYAPCRNCDAKFYMTSIEATYTGSRMLTGETVAKANVTVIATLEDGTTLAVSDFNLNNATLQTVNDIVTAEYLGLTSEFSVDTIWGNLPNTTAANQFTYTVNGDSVTITAYKGTKQDVVIPAHIDRVPVRALAEMAFANSSVTSVVIPDSVTTIPSDGWGHSVFAGCKSLKKVVIGSGLTYIDQYLFQGCTALADVTIGSGVTEIRKFAFSGCKALTNVTIPDTVLTIGEYAFENCTFLASIEIPAGITAIERCTFNGCTSLRTVTLHEGLISIGILAFANTGITEIIIPDSVTTLASDPWVGTTFNNCLSLKKVVIGSGLSCIDKNMFNGCTALTDVTIDSSVTEIRDYAFNGCTALKHIYYAGTEDEWNLITVGSKNDPLLAATVTYNYAS